MESGSGRVAPVEYCFPTMLSSCLRLSLLPNTPASGSQRAIGVADVFLSTLVSNLAKRLENWRNDSDGIANLVLRLEQIGELIDGGRMDEKYFGRWLMEVRNVVYDVEDLLDRVDYEVARRQEKAGSRARGPLRSPVRRFPSTSKDKGLLSRSMLQGINNRFDLALRDAVAVFDMGKEPISGKETSAAADFSVGSQSTSFVVVSNVYGRDRDREAVAHRLLSSQRELDVVAIVGMGGIGKTTLAQLLFNDETLSKHFEIKLWECVSDRFDVARICRNILESLTYEVPRFTSLQLLQQKLREGLEGKRIFLVLDDVWNEDLVGWEALRTPFESVGWESKILVTTRSERVARIMSASFIYHLKPLIADDTFEQLPHSPRGSKISECRQLAAMLPEIPDTCNKVLHYCDKVQLRSMHKLEPTHDSGEESEVSVSGFSFEGFPHSSDSSSSKSLQNVAPRPYSYMPQIQENVHDADEQVKPSSSEDVTQRYPFSYTFKVSLMAQLKELPSGLHTLKIEGCYGLESVPCEILDSTSLQHMFIIDCGQLKSLPQGHKRTSLKTLYIANCRVLQFPAHKVVMSQYAALEHLCLGNSCSSLESFPLNVFPKLKILSLWSCGSLKNLSVEKGLLKDLTSIDSLEIRDCNNLETFAGDGFSAPNLTSMSLFNCPKIRSLPIWIHTAMSLQSLYVKNCPELGSPPKEGLPSSLITLCVSYCNKITPEEWKLCGLNSLMHLEIEDGWQGMKSFPERGFLPRSLNSLRISKFMDLESLDKEGFQELACLESLEISCCDKLNHFPDDWPPNLSFLGIAECSLLTLKLQDKVEEEWLKLARIPCVRINGEEFLEGSGSFSFSFV